MMKFAVIACLVALSVAFPRVPEMVVDHELIAHINSNQSLYVAGVNPGFERMTILEAQRLLGVRSMEPSGEIPLYTNNALDAKDIPESFDSRVQWKDLMHPIRNQAQCGSCWAFSASEVLSDRFAIASGKASPVLSPEDMVSCDTSDMGCQGGYLDKAWAYLENDGIVTDSCFPYGASTGVAPACATTCVDKSAFTKYKATKTVHFATVQDIQASIMEHGPVQAAFMVHKSFMNYKSGIYHHPEWAFWDTLLGGHAVKLVGWGVEKNVPYWIVANSWSESWGEQGYFRIKRGDNDCKFESMVYAGEAAL